MAGLMIAAVVLGSVSSYADSIPDKTQLGTLHITVVNEEGNVVPEAPVYIYGEHKTHFVGGNDVPGTVTFTMKEGDYRISSAMIRKSGDYIDRYASPEAHVRVVAGDNVSVILMLKQIEGTAGLVSYATLKRIGVPLEYAPDLN
jgi:hypothetical protein